MYSRHPGNPGIPGPHGAAAGNNNVNGGLKKRVRKEILTMKEQDQIHSNLYHQPSLHLRDVVDPGISLLPDPKAPPKRLGMKRAPVKQVNKILETHLSFLHSLFFLLSFSLSSPRPPHSGAHQGPPKWTTRH